MESWIGLRQELTKMFERKVPFYKAMQKVEARKWIQGKETFDQYAIKKVALMHRLDLSAKDTINLVIGRIAQSSLRAVALSIKADTLEEFLETMRRVTEGALDTEKRRPGANGASAGTTKDMCRNCGKKGHTHQECREETDVLLLLQGERTSPVRLPHPQEERRATEDISFGGIHDGSSKRLRRVVVLERSGGR